MATKLNKAALLAIREQVASKTKTTLDFIGKEYAVLDKRNTDLRIKIADWATSAMTLLVDNGYPETDRPDALLEILKTKGVQGFTFDTVKQWQKARDARTSLGGEKGKGKDLPLYTLIDLGRIPTNEEHKTGGRVAVADAMLASFPDGATDDQYREWIRKYRATKEGTKAPTLPTRDEQAVAIAKANEAGMLPPVLVPEADGETFVLTHEQVMDLVLFGYAWRDKGGGGDRRTQAGYRLAFETALFHGIAAPEADGSGAPDAEEAAAIAAAEAASA